MLAEHDLVGSVVGSLGRRAILMTMARRENFMKTLEIEGHHLLMYLLFL
jgi:hypothetical protein